MNPFSPGQDIFRTQADPRFNSFANPMNPVNMNPGAWGVDPNYLTPAYLAPYRPHYQGPSGPSYAMYRPSFGTSLNQVINPFAPGGDNYGGNYIQQQSPFYDKLSTTIPDKAMSFAQNWVIPGAAAWATYKYWGGASTAIGKSVGENLTKGLFRGMGIGRAGIGTGFEIASMASRGAGALGGFAAGLALPMLATEAIVRGADSAIFDPYVNQRRIARDLRENFRGVTFGEGETGDVMAGGGFSRRRAAEIAKSISKSGAMDMTFTQSETTVLADYAARSGLLDNANSKQIASRIEQIMKQVKVVMSVANNSDFRESIEILSKLQMSGVTNNLASGTLGKLGAMAAAGGQSVMKLLNTVGTQGQYLFSGQGLTPYVGMEAAFSSNASMAAAFRSGLVSPAMMARMGGVEGAGQSALSAQIASYRSPYAQMQAYNAYMGRGETGNIISNVARFGGSMASNPMEAAGQFLLMEPALTSRHIQDRGIYGEQERIYQLAKNMPGAIGPNGKVTPGAAFLIMTQSMGISPEDARAKIAQFATFNNPDSVDVMMNGSKRASVEALLKYQQQEGLNKGIFTGTYNFVKRGMMRVQKAGAEAVGDLLETTGSLGDSIEGAYMRAFMGVDKDARSNQSTYMEDLTIGKQVSQINLGAIRKVHKGMLYGNGYDKTDLSTLKKINDLAARGGDGAKLARDFITETDPTKRANLLYQLSASKVGIKDVYQDTDKAKNLVKLAGEFGNITTDPNSVGGKTLQNTLGAGLERVLAGAGVEKQLQYAAAMGKVTDSLNSSNSVSPELIGEVERLTGKKNLTFQDLRKMSDKYVTDAGETGIFAIEGVKASTLEEAADKQSKNHMPIQGPEVKVADPKAAREQMKLQVANMQYRSQVQQLYKEGKIDDAGIMNRISALDNKETVGKFGDAVKEFAGAVTKLKGEDSKTSSNPNDNFQQWPAGPISWARAIK